MLDSHCHLTDPRIAEQLPAVLARAKYAGVSRIITIGTDFADARQAITLCEKFNHIRCAIGIHPNHSHEASPDDLAEIETLCANSNVLAVGEIGLDYHHAFADRATQMRFFEWQLDLARRINRPTVIHCREAIDDALAILKNFRDLSAVFHCFTGSLVESKKILDAGCLLGFTGAVTFKKADELRLAAQQTPRDRLLIETDSPYLTPEPMRKQKTNEPAMVGHVAALIARLWNISLEEVDAITTANAQRFFRWPA